LPSPGGAWRSIISTERLEGKEDAGHLILERKSRKKKHIADDRTSGKMSLIRQKRGKAAIPRPGGSGWKIQRGHVEVRCLELLDPDEKGGDRGGAEGISGVSKKTPEGCNKKGGG